MMCRILALMAPVLMTGAALSGVTTHLALDCRDGVRGLPTESVNIRYDASWYENGVSAKVEDNGITLESGTSGNFAWLPTGGRAHTLKLNVYDSVGSLVGLETAEFGDESGASTDTTVTYSYDGFVPTTKTKLWGGFAATDIVSATGYFCSEWVDFPCYETAYNLKKVETSVTVQFQHLEGTCVKCVGVKFFTESDGVYAQAIYSRYINGAENLGIDFDTCSYYSNTPGALEGWDQGYCVKNLRVMVANSTYCVIDLSGGMSATSYPVTYFNDIPSGAWTDEYKTTKLVLRRVEAGTFIMGSNKSSNGNNPHQVMLTNPFYIGVFEVTQKQYELVMDTRPSYFCNDAYYASRPVETVSYDMIRGSLSGASWPASNAVDGTSFIGKLRAKTGLDFDLPTEAQWEYACRAGTTTDYNNGTEYSNSSQDSNMDEVGRYTYNGGSSSGAACATSAGTAKVGTYMPNDWGLYDMHGNVWEWCLDWYGSMVASTDPKGAGSGSDRVPRGGCWASDADLCTSSFRSNNDPATESYWIGFRLARTIQQNVPVAPTYTITFDANGGTPTPTAITRKKGEAYGSLPTVTREGYVFLGWFTAASGGMQMTAESVVTTDITCYAQWDVVYTYYDNGDGTITLTGVKDASDSLVIPSSIDGKRVTSIGAYAFYNCGELTAVTIPEGVMTIGESAFDGCSGLVSVSIPSSATSIGAYAFYNCGELTAVTIPLGVTSIGDDAFWGCGGLTSVTIPSSVTSIGNEAFGCSGLMTVTISEGVTSIGEGTFYDCSELTSVTIPSSVTHIAYGTFSGCSGLMSVTIPSSVTSIGEGAFYDCDGLTNVTISEGVTSIGERAFYDCSELTSVTIPSSVTSIGCDAFVGTPFYDNLPEGMVVLGGMLYEIRGECPSSVTIPEGVKRIEDWVFSGCDGLTAVTIPSSVTSIGEGAFSCCSGLTSMTIPSSVTSIGDYAFEWCEGLMSVTISEGVTSIGEETFSGCSGLTSVTIPSSVTSIGVFAFDGTPFYDSLPDGMVVLGGVLYEFRGECPSSVTIPEGVTSIGDVAFSGCNGLTSVTIPSSVTSIGDDAFYGCSGLALAIIPSSVTSIGNYAFYDCDGLTSVTIPSSVTSFGEWSFSDCSGLMTVTISEGVTSIGEGAFFGCSGLTSVTIPSSVTNIGDDAFSGCSRMKTIHVSGNGDIDTVKRLLSESGFDVTGVTFDHGETPVVSYAVTFNVNGGECAEKSRSVAKGATIGSLPTATRIGYTFDGWFNAASGGTQVTEDTVVIGDMMLYAIWEKTGGDDPVVEPPVRPDWKGVVKEDTMVVYAVVYDRSAKATVEATGSLLAAFDAKGECRGVTEIEEGPVGMIFQLSIGVESATEKGFTLKVWNAGTGEIQEIGGTIDCNADKQIGEIFAPVTYQVGALMQTIELDSGWTWMSFAVLPEDSTVGSVLAGGAFANGDKLKAPDKAVTYYNGSWYPATYELKPGVAYMVSKGTEGVDAFELTGSQAEDGVEVSAGWNWIGSLVLTNETIAALTHSVGFANGDQVKSGSASTTWYNGKWYPATFEIRSGAGYKAKFANAGKLYFGSSIPSMPKMKLSSPAKLKAPNSAGKPTWKPVIQEDTFVAYLVISNDATKAFIESAGCTLAAFSAEGECRGVTEIEEGPLGKLYQLSVGVASATESGFTLKLWDETAKKVLDVDATLACNAEKQIGEIFEPVVLMVKTEPEQGTPFPDLGEKPSAADVQEAVKDSVDPQVIANINETNYNDFRTWAGTVKTKGGEVVGAQGVMDSPHAWLSYALDSAILIQTEPVEGDLKVDAFKPTATAGLFDFTVSVEDISVGEGAKPGNLAQVFGIEGGSTLKNLAADGVDITFDAPENGKVKFTAGPKDKTEPTFFMKVEMKP